MTRTKDGFTLIEVITAALLVLILVGAGFATFMMFVRETSEVAANLKGQRQSDALLEYMARLAREANYFLPVYNRNSMTAHAQYRYTVDSTNALYRDEIYFYKNAPATMTGSNFDNPPFAGFRVEVENVGGRLILRELDPENSTKNSTNNTPSWKDVIIGGSNVVLAREGLRQRPGTSDAQNRYPFRMAPGQMIKTFEVDITLRTINHKDTSDIKIERSVFKCKI